MTTIWEIWKRWRQEDGLVQSAAHRHNLQVLVVATAVLMALNLLHVLVFGLLRFEDPLRSAWAQHIAWAHGGMALAMAAAGWLARRARRRTEPAGAVRYLPEAVSALVVGWAVVLTVMDQAVSGSINPFINAAVGVSIVFLLRPQVTLVLLALGWCALAGALGWTTDDPALLATNRMNAATASALAMMVSVLLWRRYVQTELLQRALADTNRQLERQRTELESLARRDPLTGLLNRREFVRQAELALAQAHRQGTTLSLLMLDLDHFKNINDRLGHPAGDEVLRQVAGLMAAAVRQTDSVARFGGEEFVLLLPDTPASNAMHLAEKLRVQVATSGLPADGVAVTASIGLASMAPGQRMSLDALLEQADQALYQAKRQGRNQTVAAASAT